MISETENNIMMSDIMIKLNNLENKLIKKPKKKIEKKIPRKGIDKEGFKYIINLIRKKEENETKKFNLILLHCLLRYTGLRVNEVLNMNKHDIESLLRTEQIEVFCSKTKENRLVVLFKKEKKEFLNFIDEKNENELIDKINILGIVNTENKKLSTMDAFRWSKPYFKELENKLGGVPNNTKIKGPLFGLHSYRIEYINYCLKLGIHIDLVAQLIGHKNLQTTLIYVRKQKPLLKELKSHFEKNEF
jgi:site-specific recombinase XerD